MVSLTILLLITMFIKNSEQNENIWKVSEEFDIKNPVIVKDRTSRDVQFLKEMFQKDHTTQLFRSIKSGSKNRHNHMLLFVNPEKDINVINQQLEYLMDKRMHAVIISTGITFDKLYKTLVIEIDQSIFFFREDSLEIFETYNINNHRIQRKLGEINPKNNNFTWEKQVNPEFIKRRSDFHGMTLKGMVEFSGDYMNAHPTYRRDKNYFSNNQTYQVNGYTYGIFNDVLRNLENQFNFSTVLYKRKEVAWGNVIPLSNGSFHGTGVIGDVFFERADLAVAPLGVVLGRAHYVDFLPPILPHFAGLFVKNLEESENVELDTFIVPFKGELWATIFALTILIAILKLILLKAHVSINLNGIFDSVWTSFIAFFGGKPSSSMIESAHSYKITIYVSLLCGLIVWISYRARLTAVLSVSIKTYPFKDLESFSKTDWRYVSVYCYILVNSFVSACVRMRPLLYN